VLERLSFIVSSNLITVISQTVRFAGELVYSQNITNKGSLVDS